MLIDIIFVILLLLALFKGLQQGFIVAVFSLFAIMAGIAAAIKLSVVVVRYLHQSTSLSSKWLPVLGFLIVFVAVILLVRWTAALIKAAVNVVWLGWADRLMGVLLYALVYTLAYSIVLFYATQMHLLGAPTVASSKVYPLIGSWGPVAIDSLGKLIPFFKNMFTDLEDFFARFA